jgi:hypothetical protein
MVEMFSHRDAAAFILREKLAMRGKKHLQWALASGRLNAHYEDDGESQPIQDWAWISDERANFAWTEGRLPLDALLPDPWPRWSSCHCFLQWSQFRTWLFHQLLKEDAPSLGQVNGASSPPGGVEERVLPARLHVTLSEALSWLAFGIAMPRHLLWEAFNSGQLRNDPQQAARRLTRIISEFTDAAAGRLVTCFGKKGRNMRNDGTAGTEPIDPTVFFDYRYFDMTEDALRFGEPSFYSGQSSLDELFNSQAQDCVFRDIRVPRQDVVELRHVLDERRIEDPGGARPGDLGFELYAGGISWVDEAYDTNVVLDQDSSPSSNLAPSGTGSRLEKRGRPLAAWWDDLWVEMCRALYEGELKPQRQVDIEKAMLEWTAQRGHEPSTATIRARARKLWDMLSRDQD